MIAVAEMDPEQLAVLAAEDENTGDMDHRVSVVIARAELAVRGHLLLPLDTSAHQLALTTDRERTAAQPA